MFFQKKYYFGSNLKKLTVLEKIKKTNAKKRIASDGSTVWIKSDHYHDRVILDQTTNEFYKNIFSTNTLQVGF